MTQSISQAQKEEQTLTRPVSAPRNYYPALDGFRAFAVLLVFFHQYISAFPGVDSNLARSGWIGVDLFFVLSGFLITGILWDSRHREKNLRDFFVRRVLRILPLYYGVLLLILLATPIIHYHLYKSQVLWLVHLGNYARFIAGMRTDFIASPIHGHFRLYIGHFWSLCIEEQFYLIWPFVVLYARSMRQLLITCFCILIGAALLRYELAIHLPTMYVNREFASRFILSRMDSLVYGAVLALLIRGRFRSFIHKHRAAISIPLILPFVIVCLHRWRQHSHLSTIGSPLWISSIYSIIGLAVVGLLLQLISPETWLARGFSWKWMRRLGVVSYGFYVFHDLLHPFYMRVASYLFTSHLLIATLVIAFTGTLTLTLLSYNFYEKRFLRLKDRFSHQVHRAPKV